MDPVSQGTVGAAAAIALAASPRTARVAALCGALGGMIADLDVLIRSSDDPLLSIEFHRHFTHALIFIPVGGLIAALLLWPLLRRRREIGFRRTFAFATAGYATSGVLDACTSYGTHLLWPFSGERTAWNIISIVDPVFTGVVLGLVIAAAAKRKPALARAGIAFALAYLALGAVQNERAMSALRSLAAARGHDTAARFTAKPSIGNLILWRGIYVHEDTIHVDAVRVGLPGTAATIYQGGTVKRVYAQSLMRERNVPPRSPLARDLQRFEHFSDGYVGWHRDGDRRLLADIRYAVLPHKLDPLWGIGVDFDNPTRHAPFVNIRSIDDATWRTFFAMLRGEAL